MSTRTGRAAAPPRRRRRVVEEPMVEQSAAAPRTGAKRTVVNALRELPNFFRLLYGLLTDKRVATFDKLLVAGAIAYLIMPMDFIPDFIPFIGEVDDLFLLILAIQRLISSAGHKVVADHWMGEREELEALNLQRVLIAAAFFLPKRIRRRLRAIGRA